MPVRLARIGHFRPFLWIFFIPSQLAVLVVFHLYKQSLTTLLLGFFCIPPASTSSFFFLFSKQSCSQCCLLE
ncbi:hypothetical protein L6164_033084 [Bauhinia variegata]|uniref:Uncharacterized protein n=1 Tax=Bauhinia variegata TaxID=167791 RepID=A0ACB9KQU2_BAUVA|nr:hypothetical protein L6164_033084 [Bauhinia variegata]